MKGIIKTLTKNKTFFLILFGLFIAGLADFVSTEININVLHIAYEANFYIPFLSTLVFSLILVINRLLLSDRFFVVSGYVVVLCSLLPFVNNLIVYICV
jgi:hypothetical protein